MILSILNELATYFVTHQANPTNDKMGKTFSLRRIVYRRKRKQLHTAFQNVRNDICSAIMRHLTIFTGGIRSGNPKATQQARLETPKLLKFLLYLASGKGQGVVSGQTDKTRKAASGPPSLFVWVTSGTDIFTWPVSSVYRSTLGRAPALRGLSNRGWGHPRSQSLRTRYAQTSHPRHQPITA